jgi:hypothetical protein
MNYYLLTNREVIYDAVTQASSSLVLTANQTIYVDPTHNMPGDSFVTLNGIVFANYTSQNPLGINQTRIVVPASDWDTYFSTLTYPAEVTGSYAKHVYAHLSYTLANTPGMFGLTSADWTLVAASGSM